MKREAGAELGFCHCHFSSMLCSAEGEAGVKRKMRASCGAMDALKLPENTPRSRFAHKSRTAYVSLAPKPSSSQLTAMVRGVGGGGGGVGGGVGGDGVGGGVGGGGVGGGGVR